MNRFYIHLLPIGGLVAVIYWFIRFGKLQTKDPDFKPARKEMKKSLIMWSVAFVLYFACVIWALFSSRGRPL